jgi:molybdopterin-dependent oxidoreductase alpha subunit
MKESSMSERPQARGESSRKVKIKPFKRASGGWTSVTEVAHALSEAHIPLSGPGVLMKQNKPDGFACVSCSWAKPAQPHPFEFCEHGAKATAWELTKDRAAPEFFAQHSLTELEQWSDHALESAGRLTTPLRWDATSDRYLPVSWQAAFDEIGRELRQLDPASAVFYASGRASLEASYLWQLLARLYGNNNLPDSSNMCHESTSTGLPESLGVPVGTVTLDDFEHTDCIVYIGHNVGTNAPRMLHPLEDARRRGVELITFNPLREPGLVHFANPQSPVEMLTPREVQISTQYHQVRAGGDLAALSGLCKWLIEADALDHAFIQEHTHGFDAFAERMRALSWEEIESGSGLLRADLAAAAQVLARSKRVIAIYGMGLTQHRNGVLNVQMVANLLLLGGHMGVPGAGILPVRGHSNVQGQRTVGITEKPEKANVDRQAELYGFEPPRNKGLNAVETAQGMVQGSVKAMVCLGGNLLRALPDTTLIEPAWRRLRLSVQVATKLNRSHVLHGEIAFLLPCLGRIEIDRQAGGEQVVTMEDSTGCIHASRGQAEPAGEQLLSEPAIIAGIARATLPPRDSVPWHEWVADYSRIRRQIELTFPEIFHDFEQRMDQPGGFHRPLGARHREWKTATGKANFITPDTLDADPDMAAPAGTLRLTTVRSFDQFNTTVYGYHDRYRGVHGTRMVLLMNAEDMHERGIEEGALVAAETVANDGVRRVVDGLRATTHDIPRGCVAGYFPELNPLVPLWHHAKGSMVPGYKSVPIRVTPADA